MLKGLCKLICMKCFLSIVVLDLSSLESILHLYPLKPQNVMFPSTYTVHNCLLKKGTFCACVIVLISSKADIRSRIIVSGNPCYTV